MNNKPSEKREETQSVRRYDIVDPKRVFVELEKNGLPTDGIPNERTDRLSSFYVHEAQKEKMKLADCQPDDATDELGCNFLSDDKLKECPFCGKDGEIVTLPKAAPKADRNIELNVKAAEAKAEEKLAKVNSKKLKDKKKERGETVTEKPAQVAVESATNKGSSEIILAKSEVLAIDLPSESSGGSAKDLDRICTKIDSINEGMLKNEALGMWEIGVLLAEVRDKKLWATIRNEADGSYLYSGMSVFIAQRFYFTPDYATYMMRISASFSRKDAEIGAAKARAILAAKLPDDMTAELVAFALERDDCNNFVHKLSGLKLKIRNMKNPQLPPASTEPMSSDTSDASDASDASDERDDEDRDDDEPESSRSTSNKPATKPAQMLSVSFEKRDFSIPLVQKGSQIKAAKKIQDEPHGTLQVLGGTKIHFVVKIGADGQLVVEGRIETPY